jgi:hypothetical protein
MAVRGFAPHRHFLAGLPVLLRHTALFAQTITKQIFYLLAKEVAAQPLLQL